MARRQYRGNSKPTTLAAALQVGDSTLTLVDGTSFPDGVTGQFVLTLDLGLAGEEKVLATSRSGNSVTGLTRGFDGTVAGAHSAGAPVAHTLSATDIDEANRHVNQVEVGDNPHPQYVTVAEGNAAYVPFSHLLDADPHTQYLTTARADALFLTPAEGTAAYAPLSHTTDADPHTQYLTQARGDALFSTPAEVEQQFTTREAYFAFAAGNVTGTNNADLGTVSLTLPTPGLVTVTTNGIYTGRTGSTGRARHRLFEGSGTTPVASASATVSGTESFDLGVTYNKVLPAGTYSWKCNLEVIGGATVDGYTDTHHYMRATALVIPTASKK